ncbi:MAG: hypothetical protein IPM82_02000 [Saprospiraceae bacterium]|nr:hypothetical protein [Saprospiraceae bacterium]
MFSISTALDVVLICPTNTTTAACQTQPAVDAAYAAWLATVSASGGCDGVLTNNSTGAPPACGGSTTVTFTYTSTCPPLVTTCDATFTVTAAPTITITCPANTTTTACQTQAAVDIAYAVWLATATATGGCNGLLTNNGGSAPPACGGSKTVTFTYTSSCSPMTTTCQATFTVAMASSVVLTCPINTTIAACQTHAAIDAAYANWLATAAATGGCSGVLSNNSTGAPSACGGSKTVTFTYTSSCAPLITTCEATFTVTAAPTVTLTCPANTTVTACQTQADVDAAYATWLSTASASGGCNGVLSNNGGSAPLACGGSKTVTFTYTSSCAPLTTTCQATFTVTAAPAVTLTCPVNTTTAACQSQADVDAAYATWLATASASGGCNGLLTNNGGSAPSACGGSKTVTFTYTSSCAPLTTTCQATFTVTAAPVVVLTCPINTTTAACQTQTEVDAAYVTWLTTVSATGGCNGVLNNNSTGAPPACGGSKTVTFTYASTCAPLTTTCQATFTVTAAPVVVLTCPVNTTVAACQTQAAVDAAYATWLASVSATGGCNVNLTNNSTGAPLACGGSTTVTFTYTSTCAPLTTTCQATFTVTAAPTVVLICPANTTVAACQSQAAIDAAYATWLATVSATGGCNVVLSNNGGTAPLACGGSKTVTFTYTSTCAPLSSTCQATFTVASPQPVVLNCPINTTTPACQTQSAVNAAFATWLATASATGGCGGVLTNNNTGAPPACGGATTVTFTYASTCAPFSTTCQATFTVTAALAVTLTCPANLTVAACQTQAAVDAAYATWLATASASGGCNAVLSSNSTGAPSACGGSKTVTFTYTSTCAPLTKTCQATFTVTAAPTVIFTCPVDATIAACQTQAAVDAAYNTWLATASGSGGCNGVITTNSTGAPSACGGSKTVTFTYSSSCAPLTTSCQATFTVTAAPTVTLTCPVNTTTAACQSQAAVDAAYATWLATASASGGCNGVLTNNSTGAPSACGGSKTVTFTYTSSCAPLTTTCQATFTVTAAPGVTLTCPVNTTVPACQTQAAVDAAYANWLATVSASGGCNGVLTNNSTGAPSACGGSTTVTFTYTSICAPVSTICQAIFTVTAAPVGTLTCPVDTTFAACQTQAAVDAAFATWLTTASASGGCNGVLTNNSVGAPSACGGSTTVTFTYSSSCAPLSTTCQATFTVTAPPPVVLNCPAAFVMPPSSTQAQIDAAFATWLATANASGGCGVLTNDNTGAPSVCGGVTTVTFTYSSTCPIVTTTSCSQTFTVLAVPPGLRVAKYFAGISYATSGVPGNFDVTTEIIVQNVGSTNLDNLSIIDNLSSPANLGSAFVSVTQAPQIVSIGALGAITNATTNPGTNASYNGTGDLLSGGGLLMSGQRIVVQFRFEVNPDAPGAPSIMKNQAEAFGTVANCSAPFVVSDLSDEGANPLTSNAGWVGDSGGTNDPTLLTNCWNLLSNGIACNDLMQVSLNQDCEIGLTPDMVLEGEYPVCANPNTMPLGVYYQVFMVTDAWGAPVPDLNPATPNVHEISGSYIGQYLTVKIQDKVYKNSCWGQIFIEDKMAPVFTCPTIPVEVYCTVNLANVPPPAVSDNCDPNPVVTLVGQQVIDNNICDDGIYTVRRTYKATDNQGNMSMVNCVQNINVVRPPVDFPDDITWSCTQYSAHPNIVNPTALHPSITDVDTLEPGIDVSPTLPDTTLANTGSGIVNVSVSTICAYNVLHSDQLVNICGTSFKILRTWTVLDWCTGDIILTGVGGEDNVQIIKIADKVGPTITRTPFSVSINVPAAHPAPCKSTGLLLPPTISDNCNAVTVQIITSVGEAIYLNGVDGTNGGSIPPPGLSIGTHPVTYIATDACGNSTSITVPVTVVDNTTPTAVCVGFTEVDLPSGVNPTATVLASVFNTGSSDNCCLHHFEVRRMTENCNDGHDDTVFGPSVVFCCEDVANSPIMVVFRAFDCFGNFNDCMVEVDVNDKQPPVLATCPPNQRITCDFFANNFETQLDSLGNNQSAKSQLLDANFGQPVFADNCTSMIVTRTFASNFTQCKEGTMTRTWFATDAEGQQSATCTQVVFVDHVSDFVVTFPKDSTVNCEQMVPDFGEPTVFFQNCEMVAISYEDSPFIVVQDACYKIIRTWEVINWCVQGAVKDQEVIEVPENQLGLPFPQCDLDGDGDCDARTFRDSWTATQKPSAANATVQFGPDTDPDSDPWDGVIIYQQTIKVIDTVDPVFVSCAIPDFCIQDSTTCSTTFTLPLPTVLDCSAQLTITANTPGLGAGFGPFTSAPGTFITTFTANDGCNNSVICSDTFEVVDCKPPNVVCLTGFIVEIEDVLPPMVTVNASELDGGTSDNCSNIVSISFSSDVTDTTNLYMCQDVGIDTVEIWFTDETGVQDFCTTTIEIQANMGQCPEDTLVVNLGGQVYNENNAPVGGVSVTLSGQNGASTTGATGTFFFSNVHIGQDVTVVPSKDDNPLAGVTTYDMVLMSKHILNIEMLNSPYKMIAADVNNSKSITTFDLVELRKLILHINADFPSNTAWRFVDKAYVFPVPNNPWFEVFPEIININDIPMEVLDADFVAVKIGDVNTSYSFAGHENEERSTGTLVFETQNQRLQAGQTYTLNFRAKDFEVEGYQFTLDFDLDLLEFVEIGEGIAKASNFGFTKLDEGSINASWNQHGEHDKSLPDFSLVFRAKTNITLADALWLSDQLTRSEGYSTGGELLDLRLQFTENESVAGFELFQNKPNPFNKETVIGFRLPEAGQAQLTITDATGRVLKVLAGQCQKGYNEFRMTREELGMGAGILYYRLAAGSEKATRMMLLLE